MRESDPVLIYATGEKPPPKIVHSSVCAEYENNYQVYFCIEEKGHEIPIILNCTLCFVSDHTC